MNEESAMSLGPTLKALVLAEGALMEWLELDGDFEVSIEAATLLSCAILAAAAERKGPEGFQEELRQQQERFHTRLTEYLAWALKRGPMFPEGLKI